MPSIIAEDLADDLANLRTRCPLVHCITNYVAMDLNANALLALGASPIMAHAPEELAELGAICNALVINIGTLDQSWIGSMLSAAKTASHQKKPVILDPVGAGASQLRTQTALRLLEDGLISIVRGNAAEIAALVGSNTVKGRGVDAVGQCDDAINLAKTLSDTYSCVTVISGQDDFVVSSAGTLVITNGHPLMTKVTAMGCTNSVIVGAFAAVQNDLLRACAAAMIVSGICGELASEGAQGPGTFRTAFIDHLFKLNRQQLLAMAKFSASL